MAQHIVEESVFEPQRSVSVVRGDVPQFTLGGLFLFFTALAVCLSLAVTGAGMEPDTGPFLLASAVMLLWVVLCAAYRSLHLRATLMCHCLVPAVLAGFALTYLVVVLAAGASYFFESAGVLLDTLVYLLLALLAAVVAGCLLGSLTSLVFFVVAMAAAIKRQQSAASPRSSP